jgi:catechol 2,3-dioxygenase-like lactoylglutathione lyase family enzyme
VLGHAPLIAFIPVSDLAAARDFYVSTLGLTVTDENPFALVLDAHGTMLRLTPVAQLEPRPFTVAGWAVTDMEETIDALASRGVAFTRHDGMGQDGKGIWTAPGGDRVAWFADPDGNTLSLTSFGSA